MDQMQKPSHRLLLVGIIGVVAVIILIIVAVFTVLGISTKPETAKTPVVKESSVATKDEVRQNISTLEASVKQAAADQDAAKATLKTNEKQIKVGN